MNEGGLTQTHSATRLAIAGTVLAMLLAPGFAGAANKRAGTVWMLKGQVVVQSAAATDRRLRLGDDVSNGDTVSSSDGSEAVLKMDDGAMLALRPNTLFKIENVKRPDETGAAFVVSLLRGGLRIITGLTGKRAPNAYQVRTPVATIGIRGTDHEPYVLPSGTQIGRNPAGTYDKVNLGATFIETNKGLTDLQQGQVGFARDAKEEQRTRSMATLLRPVILRYVPEFFKQGEFDHELVVGDQTDNDNLQRCDAAILARKWLGALDGAVADRESETVLRLFATHVQIAIKVQSSQAGGATKSYSVSREEFVESVTQSVKDLEEFNQTRQSIQVEQPGGKMDCSELKISSEVHESGRTAGHFYQSKSIERFELRKVGAGYVASRAEVEAISSR